MSGELARGFSYSYRFFGKDHRAEPLEATVIVVPDVSKRLIRLFRNLAESISLEEMQLQGGELLWGQLAA